MTTLFLDFASHRKSAALVHAETTVSLIALDDHTKEAELLPSIEGMLKNAGVKLSDLTHIAAVTGPGGFMSLRVGLSLANALAWSLKIPIAGVHLSDLWHARLPSEASSSLPLGEGLGVRAVLWLHSTKKNLLFTRGFGALAEDIPEAALVTLSELEADIKDSVEFVGELIPEHAKTLPVAMVEDVRPLEEILPSLLSSLEYVTPPLLPWYGRGI